MMLNGGQLDGVRFLSRTTVKYMTSDHLGEAKKLGLGRAVAGNGIRARLRSQARDRSVRGRRIRR
jgi:hypothetical protein